MPKLQFETLYLRAYSDSSLAAYRGPSFQLRYIIMLCEKDDNAYIVYYASYKSRRMSRLVWGAETNSFCWRIRLRVLRQEVPREDIGTKNLFHDVSDSKSLFDVISKIFKLKRSVWWLIYRKSGMLVNPVRYRISVLCGCQVTSPIEWKSEN